MSFHLDSIDRKILKYLIKDARIKVVEVASFIGVTSAAIHQRIAKIKRSGVIKEFTLKLDESKLGYTTCSFIGVSLSSTDNYDKVIDLLKKVNEIVEVHYTTGQYSLFIKLYVKDNSHLRKVLNDQIQKIPDVIRTETFISLEASIDRNIAV